MMGRGKLAFVWYALLHFGAWSLRAADVRRNWTAGVVGERITSCRIIHNRMKNNKNVTGEHRRRILVATAFAGARQVVVRFAYFVWGRMSSVRYRIRKRIELARPLQIKEPCRTGHRTNRNPAGPLFEVQKTTSSLSECTEGREEGFQVTVGTLEEYKWDIKKGSFPLSLSSIDVSCRNSFTRNALPYLN